MKFAHNNTKADIKGISQQIYKTTTQKIRLI